MADPVGNAHLGGGPMQPIAHPEWTRFALCRTRPDDWWDTGDDGNRLAILLCRRACPVLGECAAGDDQPCGVVRAGVAYSDRGRPLPMCPCGRPVTRRRPGSDLCLVCAPPAVEIRLPRRRRGRPPKRPVPLEPAGDATSPATVRAAA